MYCINDTVISDDNNVINENVFTICTSAEGDSWIIQHALSLGFNNCKEFFIQTRDSYFVVLPSGYANIVKDAGAEIFPVVYGPKEK